MKPESQIVENPDHDFLMKRHTLKTDPILIEDLSKQSTLIEKSKGSTTSTGVAAQRHIHQDNPMYVQIIEGDQDFDEKDIGFFSDNDISLNSDDEQEVLASEDNSVMLQTLKL